MNTPRFNDTEWTIVPLSIAPAPVPYRSEAAPFRL